MKSLLLPHGYFTLYIEVLHTKHRAEQLHPAFQLAKFGFVLGYSLKSFHSLFHLFLFGCGHLVAWIKLQGFLVSLQSFDIVLLRLVCIGQVIPGSNIHRLKLDCFLILGYGQLNLPITVVAVTQSVIDLQKQDSLREALAD